MGLVAGKAPDCGGTGGDTQARRSTGLKVAKATDGAVDFFLAKALSDRASDLLSKKDAINQDVSSLSVALQAVESAEDIFSQM